MPTPYAGMMLRPQQRLPGLSGPGQGLPLPLALAIQAVLQGAGQVPGRLPGMLEGQGRVKLKESYDTQRKAVQGPQQTPAPAQTDPSVATGAVQPAGAPKRKPILNKKELLVGLVLGILASAMGKGREAGQFGQGFLGGRMNLRDQQFQDETQQYESGEQRRLQLAAIDAAEQRQEAEHQFDLAEAAREALRQGEDRALKIRIEQMRQTGDAAGARTAILEDWATRKFTAEDDVDRFVSFAAGQGVRIDPDEIKTAKEGTQKEAKVETETQKYNRWNMLSDNYGRDLGSAWQGKGKLNPTEIEKFDKRRRALIEKEGVPDYMLAEPTQDPTRVFEQGEQARKDRDADRRFKWAQLGLSVGDYEGLIKQAQEAKGAKRKAAAEEAVKWLDREIRKVRSEWVKAHGEWLVTPPRLKPTIDPEKGLQIPGAPNPKFAEKFQEVEGLRRQFWGLRTEKDDVIGLQRNPEEAIRLNPDGSITPLSETGAPQQIMPRVRLQGGNVAQARQRANNAIAAGADPAAVRVRFKARYKEDL